MIDKRFSSVSGRRDSNPRRPRCNSYLRHPYFMQQATFENRPGATRWGFAPLPVLQQGPSPEFERWICFLRHSCSVLIYCVSRNPVPFPAQGPRLQFYFFYLLQYVSSLFNSRQRIKYFVAPAGYQEDAIFFHAHGCVAKSCQVEQE